MKATKESKSEKIVLRWNPDFRDNIHCFFCSSLVRPDGLDFFVKGTNDFVCGKCARERAPELFQIHEDAHKWDNTETAKAFNEGVAEGKGIAGRIIIEAIHQEPIERVKRVCATELGQRDLDDIPF